jgi:hypothetical protein
VIVNEKNIPNGKHHGREDHSGPVVGSGIEHYRQNQGAGDPQTDEQDPVASADISQW